MSEAGSPDWNPHSAAQYSTECRACEHTIQAYVPVGAVEHNREGVHVRCAECRTTNFIKREDPGNEH